MGRLWNKLQVLSLIFLLLTGALIGWLDQAGLKALNEEEGEDEMEGEQNPSLSTEVEEKQNPSLPTEMEGENEKNGEENPSYIENEVPSIPFHLDISSPQSEVIDTEVEENTVVITSDTHGMMDSVDSSV